MINEAQEKVTPPECFLGLVLLSRDIHKKWALLGRIWYKKDVLVFVSPRRKYQNKLEKGIRGLHCVFQRRAQWWPSSASTGILSKCVHRCLHWITLPEEWGGPITCLSLSLYSSLKRGQIISGTVKVSWAPILLSCGYHFFWEEEAVKTTALRICVFTKNPVSPSLTTFPAAVFLDSVWLLNHPYLLK